MIPTLVSHRLAAGDDRSKAFRRTVARFDGSVAIAASAAVDARPAPAGAAGQRPGAVRRPRRRPVPRGQRALRRGRGGRPLPPPRRREPADPTNPTGSRGQVIELDGSRAGTLEGIRRLSYDGTELPVAGRRAGHPRDHDPRHRPRERTALPAQGDRRGAGVVPQDASGTHRRARRACSSPTSGPTCCPTTCGPRSAAVALSQVQVDRPGHRGDRRA